MDVGQLPGQVRFNVPSNSIGFHYTTLVSNRWISKDQCVVGLSTTIRRLPSGS